MQPVATLYSLEKVHHKKILFIIIIIITFVYIILLYDTLTVQHSAIQPHIVVSFLTK